MASVLGSLGLGGREVAAAQRVEAAYANNIYTKMFGVTPVIGAAGALSSYGNSRMRPDVIRAMTEASDFFVDLDELNRAAGRRIAEIMKAEAAMVTSCAARQHDARRRRVPDRHRSREDRRASASAPGRAGSASCRRRIGSCTTVPTGPPA